EVSLTVVRDGQNLRGQYQVGDRFIVQADIYARGVNYAYGYMIQGGMTQYSVIDQRILAGDDGKYLISVKPESGYAERALDERWACVSAAYRLQYRTQLKPGGRTWLIGTPQAGEDYFLSSGFDEGSHPQYLALTAVPEQLARQLREQASQWSIEICDI